jgi:hypothetical protein
MSSTLTTSIRVMNNDALPTQLDYAWAAGFLDGEGCFGIYQYRNKRSTIHHASREARISCAQVKTEPLEKLSWLFGGTVRFCRQTDYGSTLHQWHLSSGASVRNCIELVLPFLVNKKEEAEIVLEFAKLIRRRGRRKTGAPTYEPEELALRLDLIDRMAAIRRG